MNKSRPLVSGSIEINTLGEFKKLIKKNQYSFDEAHFKKHGEIIPGIAYDKNNKPVGHIVEHHGGMASGCTGFVSPFAEAFKLDYIDDLVRAKEEILKTSQSDWDYTDDYVLFDSKEECDLDHQRLLDRLKETCKQDLEMIDFHIQNRKEALEKFKSNV